MVGLACVELRGVLVLLEEWHMSRLETTPVFLQATADQRLTRSLKETAQTPEIDFVVACKRVRSGEALASYTSVLLAMCVEG